MTDILDDLKKWRDQLVQDARHRPGEQPGIGINTLNRAIKEIERWRAEKKS